jgi:hypothetical protein
MRMSERAIQWLRQRALVLVAPAGAAAAIVGGFHESPNTLQMSGLAAATLAAALSVLLAEPAVVIKKNPHKARLLMP